MIIQSMKRWLSYFLSVMLLSFLFFLLFWLFTPTRDRAIALTSPLPDFLTRKENKQVMGIDLWMPFLEALTGSSSDVPPFTARSVLMYDLATNKTIFEKAAKEKMPMASLTKIMTAIIVLENSSPDVVYTVRPEHIVGESSMGLSAGEQVPRDVLLYGLILRSGNDAAEVLASGYPGGRSAFIKAMNDKAKALGLTDTNFTNPSGLQGDGNQYTTAYDLLVITRYAIENLPDFTRFTSTYEITVPATAAHAAYVMQNETNLISSYPGVKGVKIGFTPEAGLCLVTYLDYNGHKIVGVLLNSENRRQEMMDLLDYSLTKLGVDPPQRG